MTAAVAGLAIDATFAAFGVAAKYWPPIGHAGGAVDCVVIRDASDRPVEHGTLSMRVEGRVVEVRKSELAAPLQRGSFEIVSTGERMEIKGQPFFRDNDPDRLVWVCNLV